MSIYFLKMGEGYAIGGNKAPFVGLTVSKGSSPGRSPRF